MGSSGQEKEISLLYVNKMEPTKGGGAEKRLLEEAKILSEDHQVKVICGRSDSRSPPRLDLEGVDIRTVKCVPDFLARFSDLHFYLSRSLLPLISVLYITRYLYSEDVDIIVDNCSPFPSLAPVLGKMFSTPTVGLVYEYHDRTALKKYSPIIGSIQLLVQNLLKTGLYHSIIVPTKVTRDQLIEFGVEAPIHIVPLGINLEEYQADASSEEEPHDLVVVSRLMHRKGIDLLISAMGHATQEQETIDLAIIGDGPEREKLEEMTEKKKLGGNITFMGAKYGEEKINVLNSCDIFVFPSRQEGFGIVLLEAMAAGKPFILNDIPVLRAVAPEGGGLFVDGELPEEFGNAIVRMVNLSKEDYERYAECNLSKVEDYTWDKVAKRSFNVYYDVISSYQGQNLE